MKSLRVFLCLLIAGALMTACEKESINTSSEKETNLTLEEGISTELRALVEANIAASEEYTIEYLTIEEFNQVLIENDLAPITLEQIGVTQSEYEKAQAAINNPEYAKSRCSSGTLAESIGDISGNNSLSVFDVVLATQYFLGNNGANRNVTGATPLPYQYYALFSYYNSNVEDDLIDEFDNYIATRCILGVYSCITID